MGDGLKIICENNFKDIKKFFEDFTDKVFIKAYRSALNKTMNKTGTLASKNIRQIYRLKAKDVSPRGGKYLRIRKAKGDNLATLNAEVKASIRPLSLMQFTKQKPIDQKGVKLSKRKRLKPIDIGSKKISVPHSFIAKVSTGRGDGSAYQIFIRSSDSGDRNKYRGQKKLIKHGLPSVFNVLKKEKNYSVLDKYSREQFTAIMKHEYAYYLSRNIKK